MTEPEITAKKFSYYQPVHLLGLDEQGRQLYRCPSAGCGDTGYLDEDGKGHCPTDDAITAFLAKALEDMKRMVPEALGLAVDPAFIPVHTELQRRQEPNPDGEAGQPEPSQPSTSTERSHDEQDQGSDDEQQAQHVPAIPDREGR